MPKDIKVNSRWFDFINSYELKDNTIIFTQIYKSNEKLVSLQEYVEYKKLLEDISIQTNQNIILEEKK